MWQIYERKVTALNWGGLAMGRRTDRLTPVQPVQWCTAELQEVSRGHSSGNKRYTTGWLGYYSIADMESKIRSLNEWLRRRIRQIYWKQWKKIKTKHDNLVRLGINKQKAWEWANSRKGYWRIADSYILHRSLTNEYLASVGYDDTLNRYKVLHSNYWTAVYRTVRTVVWEVGYSING